MDQIRILLADNSAAVRRQLRRLLETEPRCVGCGEAASGAEAVALAAALAPDLAILDHRMPPLLGPDAARLIKAARPETRVVIVSTDRAEAARPDPSCVEAWITKAEAPRRLLAIVTGAPFPTETAGQERGRGGGARRVKPAHGLPEPG